MAVATDLVIPESGICGVGAGVGRCEVHFEAKEMHFVLDGVYNADTNRSRDMHDDRYHGDVSCNILKASRLPSNTI